MQIQLLATGRNAVRVYLAWWAPTDLLELLMQSCRLKETGRHNMRLDAVNLLYIVTRYSLSQNMWCGQNVFHRHASKKCAFPLSCPAQSLYAPAPRLTELDAILMYITNGFQLALFRG